MKINYLKTQLFLSSFILYFLCVANSYSQNKTVSFNHLSAKHGLSQNGVMAIFKDSKGFMWFGTRDGLNRYDGYNFQVFRHNDLDKNSISNNFITSITEDKNGILWVGTENGLNSFNTLNQKFTSYKHSPDDDTSISENQILSILCTKNGDLWVGTENGLNLMQRNSTSFVKFHNTIHNPNSLSGNQITTLFEDSKNTLWIGTRYNGLNKREANSTYFLRSQNNSKNSNSISGNHIKAIAEDSKGNIWVGTVKSGITILKKDGSTSYIKHELNSNNSLSNNNIRELIFDESKNLWIATYKGLNYLNTTTNKFEVFKNLPGNKNSLSENSIRSLYLDSKGFLWAGTYFAGLNLLNLNSKQFTHFQHNPLDKNSISHNVVSSMAEDENGNVWVGTEGGGLNYFDFQKQTFSKIKTLFGTLISANTVKSIIIDRNQNLWIGTHLEGVFLVNFKKKKVTIFKHEKENPNSLSNNIITSLHEDSTGKIWMGTEIGINLYNPKTSNISRVQFVNNKSPIKSIFEDSEKNIWIGTKGNGLFLLKNGTIKHFTHSEKKDTSLSHNSIYDIFEDSKHRIWVGTYGGGLNLFNKTNNSFKSYKIRDGLINDIVYKIEEDKTGSLWISTIEGISKFENNLKKFKNFSTHNGLPLEELNENSILNHSSGTMFFGGFNGLVNFNIQKIKDNLVVPEVSLTELKLHNKTVFPNDKNNLLKQLISDTEAITFSHNQSIFTIDFVALNYTQLGENQYAYKLEGLETDWNYVGNKRSATYTNLEPGNYTFKVKAANNDGVWNDNIASLKITKLPPYWKTIWAYIIYVIIVLIIFLIIRKYFLINLHLENNLKLEKLEKQQIEDLTKLKLKFFTNISHDFRTPLTLIYGPLQELILKSNNKEAHSHLVLIKKNVNLMLRLINQLMDFRKIQTSKLSLHLIQEPLMPFIKEVMFSFKEMAKNHNIKFLFISRVSIKTIYFDRDKIEKILFNLLSNAFKYTPDNGKITVEVYTKYALNENDLDYLEISVKNTGHGIEKVNLGNIFDRFFQGDDHIEHTHAGTGIGLSLVKNLIELHKGYVHVNSELDKFTEFVIGIPMTDVYAKDEKLPQYQQEELTQNNYSDSNKELDIISKKNENLKEHSILIVEDNSDLRKFLKKMLSLKYNILTAENGEIGLAIVNEHNPDIIVSDIMMPKMTGLELCKTLKLNPKTKHIPIILLTARTASSIELDSYDVGANDFISKPFNMDVLKSKVHNLIDSMDSIKNQSRKEVLLDESEINCSSADENFLKNLSTYIRDNIDDVELNVNSTGKEMGMSRVHLYRKVKSITGKSPVEFIRNFRLSVAAKLLEQDKYNINEVSYKVGFQDVSYFRKCFKKKYGISSTKYAERKTEVSINNPKS